MNARGRGEVSALIAGLLYPLAFAPFGYYPIGIAALAVLFWSWTHVRPARAFSRGVLFGIGMFGAGVSWVFISIHHYGGVDVALSSFLTLLFILFLSLFPGCAGWIAARVLALVERGAYRPASVAIYAGVWCLAEWVRGWFLTGFPWLGIGYSVIDAPLGGLAPVIGVYGVTLAAAASSAMLQAALANQKGLIRGGYLVGLVALWVLGALLMRVEWSVPHGESLKVSLMQGNIPQEVKWQSDMREPTIELYTAMSEAHWDSDLQIWPESALPLMYYQAQPLLETLGEEARAHDTDILLGLIYQRPDSPDYYNSMISVGEQAGVYHKRHLVPFTEYLPLKSVFAGLVDFMAVPMSDFSSGSAEQAPLAVRGQRVGISICFEDAFGEEVIDSLPAATLLVNVSNDAWFTGSIAPAQHLQIARMRARETARPLLRATNTGLTAVIDPLGRITAVAPQDEAFVLTAEVQPRAGMTPYARLGNTPAVVIATILVLGAWSLSSRGRKARAD